MKLLLMLAISAMSINASAGLFDNKLRIYNCPSSTDAYSCSNSCKKTKIEIDFTIDKPANKVLMNIYSDGKNDRSVMIENCFVFDSKNFRCGEGTKIYGSGLSSFEERTMKNGKYVSIFTLSNSPSTFDDYSCTK